MVSHSSSASLSSLSFSRTSHDASISSCQSSPPSSPDSNSLAAQNHSGTATGLRTSASTLSIVPFSWEEKPGVLKKDKIMQTSSSCDHHFDDEQRLSTLPLSRDGGELDAHGDASNLLFSQPSNHARIPSHFTTQGPKPCEFSEDFPRIRPPPCLSHADALHANMESTQVLHTHHRPHGGSSAAAVGSKIVASLSLHKRRQHRSTPSLEDDPFWLAIVACTNDADKGVRINHRKGSKEFASREISRSDSWLARRVQESIHFEQCLPRQALENHTISRKLHRSSRGQEKAINEHIDDGEASASNCKRPSSEKIHQYTHTDAHHHHHHHHHHEDVAPADADVSMSMHSARLASKALKTLNSARAELQDRCKALLHRQQSPPVVDISCGSYRSKSNHRGVAKKHKLLPDLLGCKSNHPLTLSSSSSRFS